MINEYEPDIISLNETKLNNVKAFYLDVDKRYNCFFNCRNNTDHAGGGVAILVKKTYETEKIELKSDKEIIGVKIKINSSYIDIYSYYCPPNVKVDEIPLLNYINSNKNSIICGDLNARSKIIGCNGENTMAKYWKTFYQIQQQL